MNDRMHPYVMGQPPEWSWVTRTPPADYEEIGLGMSNCDGAIDDGFADALQTRHVYGRHSAWHFNGLVWWDGKRFCEQVWRYHSPVAYYEADTLRELMETVNDDYGWD